MRSAVVVQSPIANLEKRVRRPILGWALAGAVFLAVEAIALSGWILSGDAQRVPTGPTPVPGWMKVTIHTWEVLGVLGGAAFLYFFLVRPWRRERRITTDGFLCLAFLSVVWQDMLINYFQVWNNYNAEFFNLGHWNPHVLGWMSPNGNLVPEPLIFIFPIYLYALMGLVVFNCWILRKVRARYPHLSTVQVLGISFVWLCIGDLVLESIWVRLGFFVYPGAIPSLTLFHGHYYQFPVYEAFIMGFFGTAITSIRLFRNDRGEILPEYGLERLAIRRKNPVRLLAIVGAVNVGFLCYNVPAAIAGMYAGAWPEDIQQRSYFTTGLCGPGTDYACPGPGVPVNRRESRHLRPDGSLTPSD